MDRERVFWGGVLLASVAFITLSVSFFLFVIFPYHVDQMKRRAEETVDHMQLAMPNMAPAVQQQYLEQLFSKTEDISYLLLMDLQGVALAHSNPKRVGMRFNEPGIRRSLATGERIEQVYVRDQDNPSSPYHGEKTIDIIEPYYLSDGNIAGAVNVGISLKKVERIKRNYLLVSCLISTVCLLFIAGFIISQLRTRTLKRKADQALLESEQRLSRVIEATSDAIWEYKLDDGTFYYSPRLNEILGARGIFEKKTLDDLQALCHKDDLARIRETVLAGLSHHNKNKHEVEFRIRHADGRWQWVLGRGNVIEFAPDGRPEILSGTIVDIQERKEQEERLRESEARYRGIIENMQDGYYRTNNEGMLVFVSPAMLSMLGYESLEEVSGVSVELFWMFPERRKPMLAQIKQQGKVIDYEIQLRSKRGKVIHCATSSTFYRDHSGEILGVEGIVRDIGERKHMQEQLLQAQKLEAVGRLAGGVAHDFNNMLSVILGRSELILMRIAPTDPVKAGLMEIRDAAERSARLTQHLLTFARKQPVAPRVLELGRTVAGMIKMYQRLIGEEIEFEWLPSPMALYVKIDQGQLDQILTNLCVNARDAIATAGKITIKADRAQLAGEFCARNNGIEPGEYAILTVTDTGCGMDQEVLAHIFEPFFTTKSERDGTGLGLATVFGIVQQNGGVVDVQSTPGQGTTFTLYLPLTQELNQIEQNGGDLKTLSGNGETILLVEDDPTIITVATLLLEELNYNVLSVDTPEAAMKIAENFPGKIHLLFTDVVMPQMNGTELAKHIQALHPTIKCLFMSGYTADVVKLRGVEDEEMHFIQKPLRMEMLARKIREVLQEEQS